jgi:AcrR family transcriptional regulator
MSELASNDMSVPRVRRTQEQRRTQTRRVLLEATIATLAEFGYSGTTTLAVEQRAGISRGARVHHFASKAALLAGAVDYLYEQLSDRYADAFSDTPQRRSPRKRLHAGLHMLWSIYQRPEYTAVFELLAAARNDSELRQRWCQVAQRHRELALRAAQAFFPSLSRPLAESLIETIHASFVGLRLQGGVTAGPAHVERVLDTLEDLAIMYVKRERDHERNRE